MGIIEWLYSGFVAFLSITFLVCAVTLWLDMRKNPARLRAYEKEVSRLVQPMVSYLEIHGKWSDEGFRRWTKEKKEIEGWNANE